MNAKLPFRKWLPWIGIGLAASAAGFVLNRRGVPSNPFAAGLVISNASLDIGAIWEGSPFVHRLHVENRSSNEIQVTEVLTSCSCVAASPTSFRVPAKGTMELELKLDPRRGRSSNPELDSDYSAEITLIESPTRKKVFRLAGFLKKHPIQFSPRAVDLGEIVHGVADESKTSTSVSVVIPEEVSDIELQYDRSVLDIDMIQDPDNPHSIELRLQLRSDASLGNHESPIVIKPVIKVDAAVFKEGQSLPDVELPFRVTVLPSVYATPSSIDFGIVVVSDASTANLVVHDLLSTNMRIEDITSSNDLLTVERVMTKNGNDIVFSVSQKFATVGAQLNRVELTVVRDDEETVSLTIPVRYFGKGR